MIYYVLNTLAHILGSSFDVTQVDLPGPRNLLKTRILQSSALQGEVTQKEI